MSTPCFWLEPTGDREIVLRRYSVRDGETVWTCEEGWHQARSEVVRVEPDPRDENGYSTAAEEWDPDDPRWPTECDKGCGYRFTDDDAKQTFPSARYRRADTGQVTTLRDVEPGAMWDAHWMRDEGPDGRCLVVVTPGGRQWMIDGRASNCTLPDDREHQCWVRHGDPPNITVDKNGVTCAAGAGSIATANYHGFLRDGVFT